MNDRETILDIVASMRRGTKLPGYWRSCDLNKILAYHADRIEAAWRREKADAEADAIAVGGIVEAARHSPGNEAAMRDALSDACHAMFNFLKTQSGGYEEMAIALDKAKAALAAPARNCDVMSRSICTKHFSAIYEGNRDGLCDVQTEREKNIHLYYIKFNKWLFSPAAEWEGEDFR